jgi:enoyl-CoA hydratase
VNGSDKILLSERHEAVLVLTLNRPDRRNALATKLLEDLSACLVDADADSSVRVAIVTGSSSLFAAGADIDEIANSDAREELHSPRFRAWQRIRAFRKPLIGAVEGWCLGAGLELAMCCDFLVAGSGARFGQPETNLGIIPGGGGTALLTRRVGPSLAMQMILTGQPIDAERALTSGLVGEVVADGAALSRARALAEMLAGRAPLALSEAKASIRDADILPLDDHIVSERRRFISLLGTEDKKEGIAAFREKRAPLWQGR